MKNKTWILVPYSKDRKIVGNKWNFQIKRLQDGSFDKRKSKVVAKGYNQHPRLDFIETFKMVLK